MLQGKRFDIPPQSGTRTVDSPAPGQNNLCRTASAIPDNRESNDQPPAKPKLLQRLGNALQARHYSRRTEQTYRHWAKRYILYHHLRHPDEMGEAEINNFLTHLAVREQVSASTQNQALSALLFLYRHVLGREIGDLGKVVRARRPHRLPVVMTRDEVMAVLSRLQGDKRPIAVLPYGGGLRLLACLRLRVQDIDFAGHRILDRDGKGNKDRLWAAAHNRHYAGSQTMPGEAILAA
jgi:site-specific recombinase XerD